MHICVYLYMYRYKYKYICIDAYLHICKYASMHKLCMYIDSHMHMCTSIYVCMHSPTHTHNTK